MKSKALLAVFCLGIFLSTACGDNTDPDCTKTITIPQFYLVNNQSYSFDVTQEVPCDFPEPSVAEQIEPPLLEGFSYEVLRFVFTPDTGNNTSRLEFEIRLNNPTSEAVSGIPILTIDTDGLITTGPFSNGATSPCLEIGASDSCVLTYDQQTSRDIALINSIELVDVAYFLTN
jgi:hypothetical protein